MVIHVEVDSATVGKDSVQRVPLDADVVHKLRLHIEIRYQIFGSVTNVDSVMTVGASGLGAYVTARARRERHVANRAEVGGI